MRLPVSVVESIDSYAREKLAGNPGMRFTRADAVRVLVMLGLSSHA